MNWKSVIFEYLQKIGASGATVHYGGGHDEGGVERVILHFPDRNDEEFDLHYVRPVWNPETGGWTVKEEAGEDAKVTEAFGVPVYAEWHGFAGEFYVNGTHTYDVADRTVKKEQSVETPTWDTEEDYL